MTGSSRLPRPSAAALVRGIARCARNKISDAFALAPVQQREYGALRVGAMNDPGAARYGSWAIEDLTAAGLHALRRRLDVVNVEIVEPERKRQRSEERRVGKEGRAREEEER